MKKIFFCIAMMLFVISTANAGNDIQMKNTYISVNCNALNRSLNTTDKQVDDVTTMMYIFEQQTLAVSQETDDERRAKMLGSAIHENLKLMKSVLTRQQMKDYCRYMQQTIVNRGLTWE